MFHASASLIRLFAAYIGAKCNIPVTASDKANVNPQGPVNTCLTNVVCPSVQRSFVDSWFDGGTPVACGEHGVCLQQTTPTASGFLNLTSGIRIQTSGVCYCEPGYAGEQCAGGKPIGSDLVRSHPFAAPLRGCSAVELISIARVWLVFDVCRLCGGCWRRTWR